jgi:hypothetical protein
VAMASPDRKIVNALYRAMKPVADSTKAVDVIAACVSMIGSLLVKVSNDLPGALQNVDRIANDLKAFLRKKMGN